MVLGKQKILEIFMEDKYMVKEVDKYESRIAEKLKSFPDLSQEEILMRVLLDELNSSLEFYFRIDGNWKCEQDLEDAGIIIPNQFMDVRWDFLDILEEMQKHLKNSHQEVWRMMVFTLYRTGKYNVEYSSEKIDDDVGEMMRWRYKRLGISPGEQNMKYINGE